MCVDHQFYINKNGFLSLPSELGLTNTSASAEVVRGGQIVIESIDNSVEIQEMKHAPGFTIQASYHNRSDEVVVLRRFNLIDADLSLEGMLEKWWFSPFGSWGKQGTRLSDDVLSSYESIRRMWRSFNVEPPKLMPHPRYDDPHWRESADIAGLYREDGCGITIGAVGPGIAYCDISVCVKDGAVKLLATSEMDDIILDPGETRQSEMIAVIAAPGNDAMRIWAHMVADTHGHRTHRSPVTGWCSWYNDKGKDIEAGDITKVIECARKKPDQLRFGVVQIDDGYQKTVGDWQPNDKFPAGLEPLVEDIHSIGCMPGLWIAPMIVNETQSAFKEHPDWFQRDAQGELIGYPMTAWGGMSYRLDPTHPEVQEYMRGVIRDAVSKGFSYLKFDFTELMPGARFRNPKKTSLEVMRDTYRLYREAAGESVYLLSGSVGDHIARGALGFVDAARIGPDSCADWDAVGSWCVRESIRSTLCSQAVHKIWWVNDPDVTYLKRYRTLTEPELRTWQSAVGLSCGTVMISELLGEQDYSDAFRSFEILTPPANEKTEAFDLGRGEYPTYFGFHENRPWGDALVFMLWNYETAPKRVTVDLETLGLKKDALYHLWSFWDADYMGTASNGWQSPVIPARGCMVIRMTEVSDAPAFIGSSLHISCGAAEVANVFVNQKQFRIELTDAGARSGVLCVHDSSSYLKVEDMAGCTVEDIREEPNGIYVIYIADRICGAKQNISFSRR